MTCDHCCYRCGLEGEDITRETFNNALEYVQDGYVTLGGGEPTMHKDFELLLCDAFAHDLISEDAGIHIIHNGTHRKRALLLAKLRDSGALSAHISVDPWHDIDMIKEDVRAAYKGYEWDVSNDGRRTPIPTGRGREFMGYYDEDEEPDFETRDCVGDDYVCTPNGDVKQCGCDNAPIVGNVNDGFDPEFCGCYNSEEFREYFEMEECA